MKRGREVLAAAALASTLQLAALALLAELSLRVLPVLLQPAAGASWAARPELAVLVSQLLAVAMATTLVATLVVRLPLRPGPPLLAVAATSVVATWCWPAWFAAPSLAVLPATLSAGAGPLLALGLLGRRGPDRP